MNIEEKKTEVKNLCKITDYLSKIYKIVLITSNKEKTISNDDYTLNSVRSEYYSQELQNKIVSTIEDCGFKIYEFYNEEDFISYAVNLSAAERNTLIVINSAQKGTHIGRKSLIPAFCDLYEINYIGSNPYVVSLCRDKYKCGNVLKQNNIGTPKSWLYSFNNQDWINQSPEHFNGLLIIKPNYESSSIGITQENICYYDDVEFQKKVMKYSALFRQDILVEEFISGYEVETPVIISEKILTFFPIGIEIKQSKYIGNEILDYTTRAENQYKLFDFESFDPKLANHLINTANKVVKLINIEGFGRIDFRINKNGDYFVTDVSTNPHYTEHSSFFFPYIVLNLTYKQMIQCLIGTASKRLINANINFK